MTQRPYYLRCDESQQHARFISGHLLEVVRFLFDPSGQVGEVVFDVLVEEYFDLIRLDALFLEDVKIVLLANVVRGEMLEGSVGEFDPHLAFGIREAPLVASRNEVIAASKVRRLRWGTHTLWCSKTFTKLSLRPPKITYHRLTSSRAKC